MVVFCSTGQTFICIDGFQSNYAWFNQLWLLAFFVIGDMISKFY